MIRGLTHGSDGILNHVTRYRGKISTGYGPKEPPNMENHPVACGFFRVLKEVTETQRIGASQKEVVIKKWVLNQKIQEALEKVNNSKTPRLLEFVCLHHSPEDIWSSSLAMFSGTEGLICRSTGEGTKADYLTFEGQNRVWTERSFNGKAGCAYKSCPDFCSGKCKPLGLMKIFPVSDLSTMPYRFETRSINTIVGIESSLNDLWMLLKAAHSIKQMEAEKPLPFDGFFGVKLFLVHRKVKSGGREVFITDLFPTPDFNTMVMEPIKRGLEKKKNSALLTGAAGSISLLDQAASHLIAAPENVDDLPSALDLADQQTIAQNFGADADEEVVEEKDNPEGNEGAEKLLEQGPEKQ